MHLTFRQLLRVCFSHFDENELRAKKAHISRMTLLVQGLALSTNENYCTISQFTAHRSSFIFFYKQ